MPQLYPCLTISRRRLCDALHAQQTFDVVVRDVTFGTRRATFFFIDGFINDDMFTRILSFLYGLDDTSFANAKTLLAQGIAYCEVALEPCENKLITAILSGQTALLVDGFTEAILLDIRTYPQRTTAEPDKDKTFRGSRDGFVETMVMNCALIRRRIRSPALCFETFSVGTTSQTDVTLCYMRDRVNPTLLANMQHKLRHARVDALTMNQESLAEVLLPSKWWNPLPRFKYSERPDAAAAQVLEGSVVILVDNSPACIMLPTSLFDIIEETNDYYFPPITSTYLRFTRFFVILLMLLVTPIWLLLLAHPTVVPPFLHFILLQQSPFVPVFWQLLILEIGIDGLKLATLNTPSMLTTALSIVAGIVVGDFAVKSGWFSAEAMLYMAIAALGSYSQPSWELGYAIKFMRMGLLVLVFTLDAFGLMLGFALILALLLSTKTCAGTSYLFPLLPFDGKQLAKRLFRRSITKQ